MNHVSLDAKYTLTDGPLFISGTQALVRLPLIQRQRDAAAGLNTAGFISGYRGSPLGNYDSALWGAQKHLQQNHIHFRPGVNEDLAATSCWGTQQVSWFPDADYQGVFSIWYGKGPGVDRSGDVLKHGNLAGTSKYGGVLVLAGDDHGAKSSTTAHQSEQALQAAMIPILNPSSVQEYIEYGLYGWAMSRFAGVWIGFKCLTETIETTVSINADSNKPDIIIPEDVEVPLGGWHIKPTLAALEAEKSLIKYRLPAVQAFVKANNLDRIIYDSKDRDFAIITTGKAYLDTQQALKDLGLDETKLRAFGIRLYKLALTWPIEPEGIKDFVANHREVCVIEEKRGFIEDQVARIIMTMDTQERPDLSGKSTPRGETLLSGYGELRPNIVATAIANRLKDRHPWAQEYLGKLQIKEANPLSITAPVRAPAFCSGCPHNTSTKVPEGSMAMAGIGCHALTLFLPERHTLPPAHMGGEGANWIGISPFIKTPHMFQNLGDGTYYHSGLMAIRAAVASGVNITYKILYNDAVAMTGGQPIDGPISVSEITYQVQAEGVEKIVVVSDAPENFATGSCAKNVTFHHRDNLDSIQKQLREHKGVSVLIYEQTCATEKRRRRKRNLFPDPPKRLLINPEVCEGCGDCGLVSNCVSLQPLETPLGRKRRIDQSSCNKDYSCVKGFCPSFVTVHGGTLRKPQLQPIENLPQKAQPVDIPPLNEDYNILITGIGGTGVVTVGAILGMAAHIEGKNFSTFDLTGLSQKNGAVMSHLRLAPKSQALTTSRIGEKSTSLILGCDLLVSGAADVLNTTLPGTTKAVINNHMIPTAAFQGNPDMPLEGHQIETQITKLLGEEATFFIDGTDAAMAIAGNSIATNMFMVGFAYQKQLLPLAEDSILKAIEINAVAVAMNKQAFKWGRLAASSPDLIAKIIKENTPNSVQSPDDLPLDEMINYYDQRLTAYQNKSYGRKFRFMLERVAKKEAEVAPESDSLTRNVAKSLYKLMAYKDEYEVARLYTDGTFQAQLEKQFEGNVKLGFNLAPPLLAKKDKATGLPLKREYGSWIFPIFKGLAKLRSLRGTAFDPFGYHPDRRVERQLIRDYSDTINTIISTLNRGNFDTAQLILSLPEKIKGYGHIKNDAISKVKKEQQDLIKKYRNKTHEEN